MSESERREIKDRLVLEHYAVRESLHLLRSEARRMGEAMLKAGEVLRTAPETLQFFGVASEGQYRRTIDNFNPSDFPGKLVKLVQDIREETTRLQDLENDLKGIVD